MLAPPATAEDGPSDAEILAAAAVPEAAEVLYFQQKRFAADGSVALTAAGSNVVRQADGSDFVVSFDRQRDPDGNRYAVLADVYQQAEEDDVVAEVRVVRVEPDRLSHDQLVDAWAEANPDATAEDIAAFDARRGSATAVVSPPMHVDEAIHTWLETAAEDDLLEVRVLLRDQPAFDLPDAGPGLLDSDPAFVLDRMEARLVAIEARKTEVFGLQAELRADMEALGARVTGRNWLVNSVHLEVTPAVIDSLIIRDDVAAVRMQAIDQDATDNRGEEIRAATQIQQFLDNDYDGEEPSGRSLVDDIFVGVLDNKLDIDHPAWKDCDTTVCGGSRLTDQWAYDTGWYSDTVGQDTGIGDHGNWVAGQLIADLTQGQDPSIVSASEREARTGMTTEASFAAIDKNSPSSVDLAMQLVPLLDLDIANMSYGCGSCDYCDPEHDRNYYANAMYHDGVFGVFAAGNEDHAAPDCSANVPAAAAGLFVVGALDPTATDLYAGPIRSSSSRGGGDEGQPIVDLVTIGGRAGNGLPIHDDTYDVSGRGGTSLAAPIVAGGAANLKHLLIDLFSASTANSVGLLHAQMLLMGDGQLERGGKSFTGNGDELWGFGRLRMRMWNAAGMDAPWRVRRVSWTMSDSAVDSFPLNPVAGYNNDISIDVDHAKAVVWWYEPNLNYAGNDPAQVRTQICNDDTSTCSSGVNTDPDAHRRQLGSEVGGEAWSIKVTALDVPANADPDDHYGQQDRSAFLALYWEDLDRDDSNGPDTGIQ